MYNLFINITSLFYIILFIFCLIIASPCILTYMIFDILRIKFFKHTVYLSFSPSMYNPNIKKYKNCIKEHNLICFIKKEKYYASYEVSADIVTGATFYFLKVEDAIHFKLLNLLD